jgi:hypothetical protein
MRSETTRWLWLVAGMVLLTSEVAADEPAPSAAAPETKYRLAVLDVTPARGRQQAAALAVAAVREVAAADERFDLVPAEDVARARTLWGEGVMVLTENAELVSGLEGDDANMSHTQACAIGHTAGATRLLLITGYALDVGPSGEAGATGAALSARLTAALTVIEIATCKVREQAVVRASRTSGVSAEEAVAGAREDFARSAGQALQWLLPVHSAVRAVSRHGGEMNRGARYGVREGQYFAVHRDARAVGHVYVEDVAEDGARVSLVRGVSRLEPGDRLIESRSLRDFEVGASLTPNVLSRTSADDVFGVATGAHLMTYRPVSSNMYALSMERLGLPDFSRLRVGLEYGRQIRIMPRRLFGYARVGLGVVRSVQTLRDSAGMAFDRGTMRGFELLNAVGVKLTFGGGLVLHASASMPFRLYRDAWYLESWDNKVRALDETLTYPSPFRFLPMLTLGLGWRF